MKIVFLISSLRGGGAERVASLLCNHWVTLNHEVVLITFDTPQNDFYPTEKNITRHIIDTAHLKRNFIGRIYSNYIRVLKFRKIVKKEKPTVVVSFMDTQNMLASLACTFTGVPVVISERTYPPYFNNNNLFDRLRKMLYKLSFAFVAQTTEVANWAKEFLPNKIIKVIANPLYNIENISAHNSNPREKTIIAVGRLCPEKGFDLLIAAFKKIQANHIDWKLLILGEGAERKNLEQQLQDLWLRDHVVLLGQTRSPESYYTTAGIFVLSSRVEGFPNVLLEAMASGMPVVSFACNSGPADIIRHGLNGLLVTANDVDQLASQLESLMQDQNLRQQLSSEAVKVRSVYNIETISQQWLDLFARIAN